MPFHSHPVMPKGYGCTSRSCGLKPGGEPDLSLFVSAVDAAAAALFTRNHFAGAPVVLGRETIRGGVLRAIFANSKISNVGMGEAGLVAARRMAAAAAAEVGTTPDRVLVGSTGVIGVPLPIEAIERGVAGMAAELGSDPVAGARGIMTTDTRPKALSLDAGEATVTVVAKGAGMVAPNMATMLAYIFTDASIGADRLHVLLTGAARDSFNMLSIDTDTSTSDTCVIMANGVAGAVDERAFEVALREACTRMAERLARDAEGATKLLRVMVRGAASDAEARRIARAVVDSPLIKTMAYGADPNVGRLLMAVGKCVDCAVTPASMRAWINRVLVIENGTRAPFDEPVVRRLLAGDPVDIEIDVAAGESQATAYGCDLTEGYITENASYYSS